MLSFEPSIHAAVSVAPMPCCSAFFCAEAKIFVFARCAALLNRFVFSLQAACCSPKSVTAGLSRASRQCFTRVSTANALATSPCASPPIPSDSTKRCSGATMRKQSSLLVRTRPTSVTPPLTICTQTPLPPRDTPDPHVASNPVPTLPDALPTRTPMNPTNYSLFGHTRRRQCLGCRRLWSTTGLRLFVYNHTMLLRPSLYACLFLCALSATPPLPLSEIGRAHV